MGPRIDVQLTYLAFAQTALKSGKLTDILKSYANAREYSSSPVNMVELGAGVIEVSHSSLHNSASGLKVILTGGMQKEGRKRSYTRS